MGGVLNADNRAINRYIDEGLEYIGLYPGIDNNPEKFLKEINK
tara:strand:- start:61 stop:189 length:129 start_codon:yes stop_codon:yes gene_type:complete